MKNGKCILPLSKTNRKAIRLVGVKHLATSVARQFPIYKYELFVHCSASQLTHACASALFNFAAVGNLKVLKSFSLNMKLLQFFE